MFHKPATNKERNLAEKHIRLVAHIAYKYAIAFSIPVEDLVQEGMIGLLAAVRKYKPEYKTQFSTYAGRWIRQVLLNFCHRHVSKGMTPNARTRTDYDDRPTTYLYEDASQAQNNYESNEENSLSSILIDYREQMEAGELIDRSEKIKAVYALLNTLPAKNQKVIKLWLSGKDGGDIEAETGISRQSTQQYLAKFVFAAAQKLNPGMACKFSRCKKCKCVKLTADMKQMKCKRCRKRKKRA